MASIWSASPQESGVSCQFRPLNMISDNSTVVCSIKFTPVLFREPMLDVQGDVDDFPATSQTTESFFPPSLPPEIISCWHLFNKHTEESFTPGTFPTSGKVIRKATLV
jgi:hypothetical protein